MNCRGLIPWGVCGALALLSGCLWSSTTTPAPKPFVPEEQAAADAAQAFLVQKGKDWGSPSEVTRTDAEIRPGMKGEAVYIVTYPTPADEVKLIGERAVVVDTKTGRVEFIPRR